MKVGILGATGLVGQHYVRLLHNHPRFEIAYLAASQRYASYGEAVKGRWHMSEPLPYDIAQMPVHAVGEIDERCSLIFSAVESDVAKEWEEKYAKKGIGVISNASYHRLSPTVPMIIPEINPEHARIISAQQRQHGFPLGGFIAVKPNCSIQSYLLPLFPLHKKFTLQRMVVTTMQALSGAGYNGVSGMAILDNVIPFIEGEEKKSEVEPLKIFGEVQGEAIVPRRDIEIAAHCNRVPVLDGHMACVSAAFDIAPDLDEVKLLWKGTAGLQYLEESDRPQPRLDRNFEKGMGISVGRLRECPVMHIRFVALSHNVVRGAAGGGVAIAELLVKEGYTRSG